MAIVSPVVFFQKSNFYFSVICEVPKNANTSSITYNAVTITMDTVVSVARHESYFYGYRILYKNLDDPGSQWIERAVIRRNVPPIAGKVSPLVPYTNYSFRVSASSFKSEGLISGPVLVRTTEWGK